MRNPYLGDDPVANAQQMLNDLDEMHYGVCRLVHDHGRPMEGLITRRPLDTECTGVATSIMFAAMGLMREFPTIETMTFNREWYALQEKNYFGVAHDVC